jgi:hypothetical protein
MPKYKTIVIDSVGEMARLYFSKTRGKKSTEMDNLRQINDYAPATERMNIMFRRLQDLRDKGVNIVFIGHEQIEKIYGKGGEIGGKGQAPPEPIAIKGMPDLPGKIAPEELMRKCDVILRNRLLNGQPIWVAKQESLGGSVAEAPWVAGCRFHTEALKPGSFLPPSYEEIVQLAAKVPDTNFAPPYIWMIYGAPKTKKTLLVCKTFPKPMRLFDLDRGRSVLGNDEKIKSMGIDPVSYNSEESSDYDRFVADITSCFAD